MVKGFLGNGFTVTLGESQRWGWPLVISFRVKRRKHAPASGIPLSLLSLVHVPVENLFHHAASRCQLDRLKLLLDKEVSLGHVNCLQLLTNSWKNLLDGRIGGIIFWFHQLLVLNFKRVNPLMNSTLWNRE